MHANIKKPLNFIIDSYKMPNQIWFSEITKAVGVMYMITLIQTYTDIVSQNISHILVQH